MNRTKYSIKCEKDLDDVYYALYNNGGDQDQRKEGQLGGSTQAKDKDGFPPAPPVAEETPPSGSPVSATAPQEPALHQ